MFQNLTCEFKERMEKEGVRFVKDLCDNTWVAEFAGETVVTRPKLGDCIWAAAEILNI